MSTFEHELVKEENIINIKSHDREEIELIKEETNRNKIENNQFNEIKENNIKNQVRNDIEGSKNISNEKLKNFVNKFKNLIKTEKEKFDELNYNEKYLALKKFMIEFVKTKEQSLYEKNNKEANIKKENAINDFFKSLNRKEDINYEDITTIKNFALTENGFLKNEFRSKFYKILFFIDKDINLQSKRFYKKIKLLYKDPQKKYKYQEKIINLYERTIEGKDSNKNDYMENNQKKEYIKDTKKNNNNGAESREPEEDLKNYSLIFDKNIKVKYDNIIEVDIQRTIFNSILNKNEKEKVMLDFLKQIMIKKLKNFFSLDEDFKYYQGFHDIAIFIYIIILGNSENVIKDIEEMEENEDIIFYEILQRLAEFYVKDYLAEITINKQDEKGNIISTSKTAFKFDNLYRIVNDIKKNLDSKIFDLIQNKSMFPDPIYTLPWILTYFTHDINDLNQIYRIFDYVLFDHPASILYLAANVINKIKRIFNINLFLNLLKNLHLKSKKIK